MPGTAEVKTINPTLGKDPYILIERLPDPDREDEVEVKVRTGGDIGDSDDIVSLLLLVVEQLTGVSTDLYAEQVDLARRAAGLAAAMPPGADVKEFLAQAPQPATVKWPNAEQIQTGELVIRGEDMETFL
jgi:hypothetical protein